MKINEKMFFIETGFLTNILQSYT